MADASLQIGNSNWAVKPSLLLGYNVGVNGYSPVEMDVVRATPGTRTNALGIIDSKGSDIARIDYSSGIGNLLLEPQRTNLDTTSQTFSSWTLDNSAGVTTASVVATNPYGFATVQKVIPSAVLGQHRPLVNANYSTNGRIWVIAKADGYNFLSLGDGGGVAGGNIIFNLSNGTISGSQSGYIPSITPLGNGWYQCSINTVYTGLTVKIIIIRNNNTTADYVGDGTSGVLIAHKQLEVGEYNTSSILTNGGTVTRNADGISKTGISDLIGQTQGVVFIESAALFNDLTQRGISISDSTNSNRITIFYHSTSNNILVTNLSNNVTIFQLSYTITDTTQFAKIAIRYSNTLGASLWVNGVNRASTVNTTLPASFNRLGFDTVADRPFFGKLKQVHLYKTYLTDTEMANLTTL